MKYQQIISLINTKINSDTKMIAATLGIEFNNCSIYLDSSSLIDCSISLFCLLDELQ